MMIGIASSIKIMKFNIRFI